MGIERIDEYNLVLPGSDATTNLIDEDFRSVLDKWPHLLLSR